MVLTATPYELYVLQHVVLPDEIEVSLEEVGGLAEVKSAIEEIFFKDVVPEYMVCLYVCRFLFQRLFSSASVC